MQLTKENFERAMDETRKAVEFHQKIVNKVGHDVIIKDEDFKYEEGDMIYVNLQVGYPHEMMFGHWCYVLKIYDSKVFVVPTQSVKGSIYSSDMIIKFIDISGYEVEFGESLLSVADTRFVDVQRIDPRKPRRIVMTDEKLIKDRIRECLGLEEE